MNVHGLKEELNLWCIRRQKGKDNLRWGYRPKGVFSLKEAYILLFRSSESPAISSWNSLWGKKLWPKITIFCWLVMHKRILTGENLKRRGMYGPYQCPLCKQEEELIHLTITSLWVCNSFLLLFFSLFYCAHDENKYKQIHSDCSCEAFIQRFSSRKPWVRVFTGIRGWII